MPLRFLHISDIHFQRFLPEKRHWDLDVNIQNEVELDLSSFCSENGFIKAILIGGDIAFSGSAEEYETADNWLRTISKIVGCELENILTIPGNHDVDRTKLRGLLLNNHKAIRASAKRSETDQMLRSLLETDADADLILKPFENYNHFAAKYGSVPEPGNRLFWEKNFDLSPYKVRIRGVNSALISNKDDDINGHKLFLGSHQTNIKREKGVINIFMCHHPPQWLIDSDEVERDVFAKSSILLYGHKHQENSRTVDASLVLSAGAMQPARAEDAWQPCYNIIEIDIISKAKKDYLSVKVWKRQLDTNKSLKFIPKFTYEGSQYEYYELPIDDSLKVSEKKPIVDLVEMVKNEKSNDIPKEPLIKSEVEQEELIDVNKQDYLRKLAYMFLSLPYHKKLKIAVGLDLCDEMDEKLSDLQKSQMYIKRAKENNKLSRLWDATIINYPEYIQLPNPF
jgi:predicted MPP superfamily phosphohydrolase